jgi:predicted metal-dependent hydrolase
MSRAARTPDDLTITPRNRTFGRGQQPGRFWYGGDPAATAIYNVLSLTFPKGEAFFIDSVRHYRDAVEPALAGQIEDFAKQEAVHSREHMHFNRQVKEAGYDLSEIERNFTARFAETKKRPPLINLAVTVALEHFTAILAHGWPTPATSEALPRRSRNSGAGTPWKRSSTRGWPTTPSWPSRGTCRPSSVGRCVAARCWRSPVVS